MLRQVLLLIARSIDPPRRRQRTALKQGATSSIDHRIRTGAGKMRRARVFAWRRTGGDTPPVPGPFPAQGALGKPRRFSQIKVCAAFLEVQKTSGEKKRERFRRRKAAFGPPVPKAGHQCLSIPATASTAAAACCRLSTINLVRPCLMISDIEPRLVAMTGVPQAMASTTDSPNGSSKLIRWRSACARQKITLRFSSPTGSCAMSSASRCARNNHRLV